MSNLVTILSIQYPPQVYIIKARLESEGIECFIKNELTIQTDPFLSNAIGGIQLQVKEEDVEEAVKILDAEGYQKYRPDASNPYQWLEDFANKLPFLKRARFEVRLGVFIGIVIAVIYFLIFFLTSKNTYLKLAESEWNVDYITYKGKNYVCNSVGLIMYVHGRRVETINFGNAPNIELPGFNTNAIRAQWELINDSVIITHADTFQFVYNGRYSVEFSRKNLILKSKNTTINCTLFKLF